MQKALRQYHCRTIPKCHQDICHSAAQCSFQYIQRPKNPLLRQGPKNHLRRQGSKNPLLRQHLKNLLLRHQHRQRCRLPRQPFPKSRLQLSEQARHLQPGHPIQWLKPRLVRYRRHHQRQIPFLPAYSVPPARHSAKSSLQRPHSLGFLRFLQLPQERTPPTQRHRVPILDLVNP